MKEHRPVSRAKSPHKAGGLPHGDALEIGLEAAVKRSCETLNEKIEKIINGKYPKQISQNA